MAVNGRGIIDFLSTDFFTPARLNAMLEQIRSSITSLNWSDITGSRPFEKMESGEGTFASTAGVTIAHSCGASAEYIVCVTPLGSSSAKLGEFWVEKGTNSIVVRNTGEDIVTKFQYMIIRKQV